MKIGILTFFESENYGTVLQAYALQKYLQNMGHTVELIHIKRKVNGNVGFSRSFSFFQRVRIKAVSLLHRKDARRKTDGFLRFRKEYLNVSPDFYETDEQLMQMYPKYDLYISGGDQIWNPYHKVFSTHYMFDFLPDTAKRISYGTSFGVSEIHDTGLLINMQRCLKKYQNLYVRESTGVQIIENMDLRANRVMDPVFLICDEWKRLSQAETWRYRKPYCLVYALVDYNDHEDQTICRFAKEKNLDIVIIPYNRRNCVNGYKKAFDLSPTEFLLLLANADYVFTNSFHGLAFSIIFERQFSIIPPATNEGKQKQGRLIDFVESIGISEQQAYDPFYVKDYQKIGLSVKKLINESKCCLDRGL